MDSIFDYIVTRLCYLYAVNNNDLLIQVLMKTEDNMHQRSVSNIDNFCELLSRGNLLDVIIDFILEMKMVCNLDLSIYQ